MESKVLLLVSVALTVHSIPWHYMRNDDFDVNDNKIFKSMCSFKNLHYFILTKRMTWIEAQDACDSWCSELATFPKKENLTLLISGLRDLDTKAGKQGIPKDYFDAVGVYAFPRDRRYWIGLTDLGREGVWIWSRLNEQLNYTDMWYPQQPDHFRNKNEKTEAASEHCVSLWNPIFYEDESHTLNDEPCDMRYYAICNPRNDTSMTIIKDHYVVESQCYRSDVSKC